MKKTLLFLNFVILFAICTALPLCAKSKPNPKLGQLITQKIKIGGKKVSCQLIFYGITEYDEAGNEVHVKNLNDWELLSEYDSKGNLVHRKITNSSGTSESWSEYDENENLVHTLIISDSMGQEDIYMEYDANGNKIFE